MSEIEKELAALLKAPIHTPADADRAARAAEALAELMRASEKARRALSTEPESRIPAAPESSLAGKTLHDAAAAVLEEAGRPLHAKELGSRILARGWTHPRSESPRPDQIVYQLAARLPRHSRRFRRVAPNTFALAKWGDTVAAKAPQKPRVALFKGPGGKTGRLIGDSDEQPAGDAAWRSS
jgi:hypothetical protein